LSVMLKDDVPPPEPLWPYPPETDDVPGPAE
jgi:hypothetical protein